MKPCISQATTMSTPLEEELPALARGGWSAVEFWLTKLETFLETHTTDNLVELLDIHGLVPAAAAGQGGLLLSRGSDRELHWNHFRSRLALLESLNVPVVIVAADRGREPCGDDYLRGAEALGEAAELAARHRIRIALEFQKSSAFCASLDTAAALVAQCGSAHAGVCLDLFHYYTGPSKFEDLGYLTRANLAWVQISDLSGIPRELAGDRDRILPGDGDLPIGQVIEHIGRLGYDGGVSLELLNPQLWQVPIIQLADLGRQAVCRALGAWNDPPQEHRVGA
jgi:sugar phosphate isomerase/epimerase